MTPYAFYICVALMVADSLTSIYGLERGAKETMQPTRWAVERLGNVWGVLLVRVAVLAVLIYFIPLASPVWWIGCALPLWAVVNNIRVLRNLK